MSPVSIAGSAFRPLREELSEQRVLRIGLALAAAYLVAAVVAFALTGVRSGHWAGTHLAFAGAALVAIGAFMPHFGATLAGSRPAAAALRLGAVLALAAGTLLVVVGVLGGVVVVVVAGAGALWLGLALTAWTTFRPMRQPLARRHPIAQLAYGAALLQVAIGISLPVLLVAGWEPAVAGWSALRSAHVWLNLFGFLSLTIAATLVYLYPTVLGARIRAHPSLAAMVGGTLAGPPLVALGLVLASGWLLALGGLLVIVGGAGQLAYGWTVWRSRGRWTTEHAWHRLTAGHLSAAMAWYLLAGAAAAATVASDGLSPAGWSLGAAALPLLGGWVMQVVVGAWTYLLPSVAAREHATRAAQRAILARWAMLRLVGWNAGVAVAWAGLLIGVVPLALLGIGLFSAAALNSALLLFRALLVRGPATGLQPAISAR